MVIISPAQLCRSEQDRVTIGQNILTAEDKVMFEKTQKIISTVIGFILIGLLVLIFVLRMDPIGSVYPDSARELNTGWTDKDGNETGIVGITDPPDTEFQFYRSINGSILNGESLCFTSRNVLFSIYLNGKLIYDFHPTLGGYYGNNYGDCIHTVRLPVFSNEATLRIDGTVLLTNKWTGFQGVVLRTSGAYITEEVRVNAGKTVVFLLVFGFGAIIFVFGLVESFLRRDMLETISLGVIIMLLSLWTNGSAEVFQIITGNSAMIRVADYTVMCLLPIPVLTFVASFTNNLKSKPVMICIGLCVLNFFVQFFGVPAGLVDYGEMLRVSHILIIIGMPVVAYIIVKSIRERKIDRVQRVYLITALAVIFGSGLADMVRYYSVRAADPSFITRIGLVIFAAIFTVYEFKQLVDAHIKSHETEMMRRLAMEDTLTGIYNRTAFTFFEKELLERQKGKCLFIHLDVNFLKKVNDTYGHAEGDRHIIAAARIIKESFGQKGHCFRVGGDEFFVILDDKDLQAEYTRGLEKFRGLIAEYNKEEHPVPLSIAHGFAEYDCAAQNPEDAERLADSRMYENKKQMKSEGGI